MGNRIITYRRNGVWDKEAQRMGKWDCGGMGEWE